MDIKQIKDLMRKFDESGLSGMKISQGEFSIEMEKVNSIVAAPAQTAAQVIPAALPTAAVPAAEAASSSEIEGETIDSPMVGSYYSAPSPDSPPFVKVGDTIKKGQTIAILEAMKIMNELEAEFDCKITQILVKDGQAVEYDMPMFVVERL